jgi:hypothetical protein
MWRLRDANGPCLDVSPVHSCTGLFRLKNEFIGICFSGPAGPSLVSPFTPTQFRCCIIALLAVLRQAQQRLSRWDKQSSERSALYLHRLAFF